MKREKTPGQVMPSLATVSPGQRPSTLGLGSRAGLLAIAVAIFLLIPAAQAFAANKLIVRIGGTGEGTVTSAGGINCHGAAPGEGTCEQENTSETPVFVAALHAEAEAGSEFVEWNVIEGVEGECSAEPAEGECAVAVLAGNDAEVEAVFEEDPQNQLTVTIGGTGEGAVTSSTGTPPINCHGPAPGEGTCVQEMEAEGTFVGAVLQAAPEAGTEFVEWKVIEGIESGSCSEPAEDECAVVALAGNDAEVEAVFEEDPQNQLTVTIGGTGEGAVTSSTGTPPINCHGPAPGEGTCVQEMESNGSGASSLLHAEPALGFELVAWSVEEEGGGLHVDCFPNENECAAMALAGNNAAAKVFFSQVAAGSLTVILGGSGEGTVTSEGGTPLINCGYASPGPATGTCETEVGGLLTLTATAASGSEFAGWSGCDAEPEGRCEVSTGGFVEAQFDEIAGYELKIVPVGTGEGAVGGLGGLINCSGPPPSGKCEVVLPEGMVVTLAATPSVNSTFGGWNGCDAEPSEAECEVEMNAPREVEAAFDLIPQQPLTIKKTGIGDGTVASTPSGIDCEPGCAEETAEFNEGSTVTLTATPDGSSTFDGWHGSDAEAAGCDETGAASTCEMELGADKTVEAAFDLEPPTLVDCSPDEGSLAGGTPVTCTGTNLSETSAAHFGSNLATELTVKSPTEIEATSPAGPAGQVDVTATTPGGTSAPAAHFTYVKAPSVENGLTGIHTGPFDFPTQTTLPLRGEVNSNGAAISACYFAVAPQSEPVETVAIVPCEPPPVTENEWQVVETTVDGLTSNTAYVWRIVAENAGGTTIGTPDGVAATLPNPPAVTNDPPSSVGQTTAVLNGHVDNEGDATASTCKFVLALQSAPETPIAEPDCSPMEVTGDDSTPVEATVDGLIPGSAYVYYVRALNRGGIEVAEPMQEFSTLPITHTLTIVTGGTGGGSVACDGGACASAYAEGTTVSLAAIAAPGSTFAGWSGGGCSGTDACLVTLTADTTVMVTFDAIPAKGGPPATCDTYPAPCRSPTPGTATAKGIAVVKGHRALLRLSCRGGGACKGLAKLFAELPSSGKKKSKRAKSSAPRHHKKTKLALIGKARFRLAASASKTLKVKITNGKARKLLKQGKALKAKLTGSGIKSRTVKLKPMDKKMNKRHHGKGRR